jgi:hypothetical protein
VLLRLAAGGTVHVEWMSWSGGQTYSRSESSIDPDPWAALSTQFGFGPTGRSAHSLAFSTPEWGEMILPTVASTSMNLGRFGKVCCRSVRTESWGMTLRIALGATGYLVWRMFISWLPTTKVIERTGRNLLPSNSDVA